MTIVISGFLTESLDIKGIANKHPCLANRLLLAQLHS